MGDCGGHGILFLFEFGGAGLMVRFAGFKVDGWFYLVN